MNKINWTDARIGDSALVTSENKMGVILKDYGRKFHLRFADGSEKTYDAYELNFFNTDDDYERGGSIKKGDVYEWNTVEYDSKKGNNYKVVKNIEITDIDSKGQVIGRVVGTSNQFIIRDPQKNLKSKVSKMETGGDIERGGANMYIELKDSDIVVYHGDAFKIYKNAKPMFVISGAKKGSWDELWQSIRSIQSSNTDGQKGSAHIYVKLSNGDITVYHGDDIRQFRKLDEDERLFLQKNVRKDSWDRVYNTLMNLKSVKMENGGMAGKTHFQPVIRKDKNNPNFLYIDIYYPEGKGILSIGQSKTMFGREREEGALKALQIANSFAKQLEEKYNIEDIEVNDLKNGKVQVFAVSDDFVKMGDNLLNNIKMENRAKMATGGRLPSNIEEFAKRKGVFPLVKKVAGWAEKVGARIAGGTAVGKYYDTLVLDLNYEQEGEIRIDTVNDTVTLFDEDVNSFSEFKEIYLENTDDKMALGGKMENGGGIDAIQVGDYVHINQSAAKISEHLGNYVIITSVIGRNIQGKNYPYMFKVSKNKLMPHSSGKGWKVEGKINPIKPQMFDDRKMENGGIVGQEIVFDDSGERNTGVIKEIHETTGDYIVATDDGRTVLAQKDMDVISLGKMRTKSGEGKKRFGFFEDGGNIAKENKEMINSQTIEARHHVEELSKILTKKNKIEPWVVARMERATNDLSDVTHYLEGKKMAKGGGISSKNQKALKYFCDRVSEEINDEYVDDPNFEAEEYTSEAMMEYFLDHIETNDMTVDELIDDYNWREYTLELGLGNYKKGGKMAKGGGVDGTLKIGQFVRYKKGDGFTGGRIKTITGNKAEVQNWDGSSIELTLSDLEYVTSWNDKMAKGGGVGSKLKATYIPNRNIDELKTVFGQSIKGKDLIDGAYTTRKGIKQKPKMARTMFEEETYEFSKGGGVGEHKLKYSLNNVYMSSLELRGIDFKRASVVIYNSKNLNLTSDLLNKIKDLIQSYSGSSVVKALKNENKDYYFAIENKMIAKKSNEFHDELEKLMNANNFYLADVNLLKQFSTGVFWSGELNEDYFDLWAFLMNLKNFAKQAETRDRRYYEKVMQAERNYINATYRRWAKENREAELNKDIKKYEGTNQKIWKASLYENGGAVKHSMMSTGGAVKKNGVNQFAEDEKSEGYEAKVFLGKFDGRTFKAQSTDKTWDDGTPVTKYFSRNGFKDVKLKGEYQLVDSDRGHWYIQGPRNVWYAVRHKDYGTPPFEFGKGGMMQGWKHKAKK